MLLDLLEPVNCPAIQSATLLTLVVALLDCPANTRAFEALDGLLTVTSLFKSRSTSREVKLKLVEFLYFYLMPETPAVRVPAASMPAAPNGLALGDGKSGHHRSPSKLALTTNGAAARRQAADFGIDGLDDEYCGTLSTEEKQALLGKHLSNVEDLVKDLRHCTPFGGVVC